MATIVTSILYMFYDNNPMLMACPILLAVVVYGVTAIWCRIQQRKTSLSRAKNIRDNRIEKLLEVCSKEEFSLTGLSSIDWLIHETEQRIEKSPFGGRVSKAVAISFDKLIYPLIAFICGVVVKEISISAAVEASLYIIFIAIVLALMIPIVADSMDKDKI